MGQQVRRRFQKSIPYTANAKNNDILGRGMILRELHVNLRGQLTVAAAANTAAATLRGDEWAVVKRIDIIANNTDVVKSISGNAQWWQNFFHYEKRPRVTGGIGDAATLNPTFDSVIIIPFWMPRSLRGIDTALDTRELSDLKVEVTWGSHLDINAAATGFTVAPQLEFASLESFGVNGPFSQWRQYEIQTPIVATNPRMQIPLPVGPMYRSFLLNFTDGVADSPAILNNFKLVSGSTVFADVKASVLRQVQELRTGLSQEFDLVSNAYQKDRRGTANVRDGWFYYDHVNDGFNSEAIDTLGFSEFQIELDVTLGGGATKVFVYPSQIIPVRQTKKAA